MPYFCSHFLFTHPCLQSFSAPICLIHCLNRVGESRALEFQVADGCLMIPHWDLMHNELIFFFFYTWKLDTHCMTHMMAQYSLVSVISLTTCQKICFKLALLVSFLQQLSSPCLNMHLIAALSTLQSLVFSSQLCSTCFCWRVVAFLLKTHLFNRSRHCIDLMGEIKQIGGLVADVWFFVKASIHIPFEKPLESR